MDSGAWQATIHGVTEELHKLSDLTIPYYRLIIDYLH